MGLLQLKNCKLVRVKAHKVWKIVALLLFKEELHSPISTENWYFVVSEHLLVQSHSGDMETLWRGG